MVRLKIWKRIWEHIYCQLPYNIDVPTWSSVSVSVAVMNQWSQMLKAFSPHLKLRNYLRPDWEVSTCPRFPRKRCFSHFQLLLVLCTATIPPSIVRGNHKEWMRSNLYWMARFPFDQPPIQQISIVCPVQFRTRAKFWKYKATKDTSVYGSTSLEQRLGRMEGDMKLEREAGTSSGSFLKTMLMQWLFIGHISWGFSSALKNIISFLIFPSPHSKRLRDHMIQLYPDTSPSSSKSKLPCKLPLKGMDFTEFDDCVPLCLLPAFLPLFLNSFSFWACDTHIK